VALGLLLHIHTNASEEENFRPAHSDLPGQLALGVSLEPQTVLFKAHILILNVQGLD